MENSYKKNISLDLSLTDYFDNFGNKHSVTDEQIEDIISSIQPKVDRIIYSNKQEYLSQNKIFEFESFKIDPIILKNYTEDDIEKYKHFVWEFYSKYAINFKKDSEKHLELIRDVEEYAPEYKESAKIAKQKLKKLDKNFKSGKIAKIAKKKKEESGKTFDLSLLINHEYDTEKHKILQYVIPPTTVKSKILYFLAISKYLQKNVSEINQYKLDVNKENFKNFVDFILDSGMVSLNEVVYKNKFLENSESIDNFTVGAALILLCIQLDYKQGFDYLITKGLCKEDVDTDNLCHSFTYNLIKTIEYFRSNNWREWDYMLENNLTQNVDSVLGDESENVNIDALNNLINKLRWINVITTKFPKLKFSYVNEKCGKIGKDGRRYWSSSGVVYKLLTINPIYIDKVIDNKPFSDIVYSLFSDEFIKNNTLPFNKEVNLIKDVFDYFGGKKDEKTLCQLFKIHHDTIKCSIEKIESGGYIHNNNIKKDYEYTLKVKEIVFSDEGEDGFLSIYFYNNTNPGYSGSSYVLENKFEISKFIEDKEGLIFLIEKWLFGLEIKNKKPEDFVDPKRKKVLEEIMKREQEICELKKAIGEDC
jgi:hypothetical protein